MSFISKVKFLSVLIMFLNGAVSFAADQGSEQDFGSWSSADFDKALVVHQLASSSSQSSQSQSKKKKASKAEYSNSKINDGIIGGINERFNLKNTPSQPKRDINNLRTVDVAAINALSPESIETVSKKMKLLKESDDNGRTGIIESLAVKYVHSIAGQENDQFVRNDKLVSNFQNESHVRSLINASGVDLSDRVIAYASAVDIAHPMYLREKRDRDGKLINIAGGHVSQCYKNNGACLYKSKGIASLDGNVIGIETVEGNISKTVYIAANAQTFISNLQQGTFIAKESTGMNVYKISPNNFIGSYPSKENRLLFTTQFPILTVSDVNVDVHGNIPVGNLVNFRADGEIDHATKEPFAIAKHQYDAIMSDSNLKPFDQKDKNFIVKDITDAVNGFCKGDLNHFGLTKLPGRVYGVKKN